MDTFLRTFGQLLKEFWIPLLFALLWTIVSAGGVSAVFANGGVNFLKTFAPAFFFCSWMSGQVFRVKKQLRVEDGIQNIEKRLGSSIELLRLADDKLNSSIKQITESARDTVASVSLGQSCCFAISPTEVDAEELGFFITEIRQHGAGALLDVTAHFGDIQLAFELPANNRSEEQQKEVVAFYKIGDLRVGEMYRLKRWVRFGERQTRRIEFVFSTRIGFGFEQRIIYRPAGGRWVLATIVKDRSGSLLIERRPRRILYEYIHPDFPREPDGSIDWITNWDADRDHPPADDTTAIYY
jgi:hypothetical protein